VLPELGGSYQTHNKIQFLSQKSLFVGYLDIIDTKSQKQTVIKSVIKMNLQDSKGGDEPIYNYFIIMITVS